MIALLALLGQLALSRQDRAEGVERKVDVAKEVVVLVNEAVPESVAIGEHYAERRGIPKAQVLRIRATGEETCTWESLRKDILEPLRKFLEGRPEVLYVVPTYGVPVKTREEKPENDGKGGEGAIHQFVTGRDYACVDREIELLRVEHEIDGWIESKTFKADRRITREDNVYIVSRLDGPTAEAARALVDLALYGEAFGVEGTMFIDTRGLKSPGDGYTECDVEMKGCAKVCEKHGIAFKHDDGADVVDLGTLADAAHYWAWYTGNVVCSRADFRFNRGAVGAHLHSFSAGALRSRDKTWTGPLVHHGITGTWGTVYEPLIAGFPYGTMFFDRFFRGHTFGESLQMSSQMTSWMAVFVGDPLYAPYAAGMKERQAKNRALAKEAYATLTAALDAGDLAKADAVAREIEAIGVAYAGAEDCSFLVRETRSRLAWPDRKAHGTVAELRRALDAGDARRAAAISPSSWDANRLRARKAAEARDWNETLAAVEVTAKVQADFELRVLKGQALRGLRRLKEALAEFEAALAMRSDLATLVAVGEILIEQKQYAEAIARLEQVYQRNPNDREVAGELGKAYVATKEWKKAVAVLDNAVRDLPTAWADVRDYVGCTELLLAAAKGEGTDKSRAQSLGELVKDLKSAKIRATPAAQAAKIGEAVDQNTGRAEKLGDVPMYDDRFNGVPRLRLATRTAADLQVYVAGPMSFQVRVKADKGKERPVDLEMVPGVYSILVITLETGGKSRMFFREQRLEPGLWYGLGWDDKYKVIRPAK